MNTLSTIKIYVDNSIILVTNDFKSFANELNVIDSLNMLERTISHILCNNTEQTYLFNSENPKESLNKLKKRFEYLQAAGGVVVNQLNEYLLIYRRNLWDLPKGKVEETENIQQAALREIKEETGIVVKEITSFITNTWHCYLSDDNITVKETSWYLMAALKQQGQPQKEEQITEVRWVDVIQLKTLIKTRSFPLVVDLLEPVIK